ncbi:MAG TPA: hypothetical protein VE981_05520 [Planctomycetota bacterium]|nr:hypothetical protein [Planctomycetota bacterium]
MSMQRGQVWNCSDPTCGGQILVTRGPQPGKAGSLSMRCCCGSLMYP